MRAAKREHELLPVHAGEPVVATTGQRLGPVPWKGRNRDYCGGVIVWSRLRNPQRVPPLVRASRPNTCRLLHNPGVAGGGWSGQRLCWCYCAGMSERGFWLLLGALAASFAVFVGLVGEWQLGAGFAVLCAVFPGVPALVGRFVRGDLADVSGSLTRPAAFAAAAFVGAGCRRVHGRSASFDADGGVVLDVRRRDGMFRRRVGARGELLSFAAAVRGGAVRGEQSRGAAGCDDSLECYGGERGRVGCFYGP